MKKKILVIESNFFSGASLINFAVSKNLRIAGVSRSKESKNYFLPYYFSKNKKNFKPQFIVNFAAKSMVAESWHELLYRYRTNIILEQNY